MPAGTIGVAIATVSMLMRDAVALQENGFFHGSPPPPTPSLAATAAATAHRRTHAPGGADTRAPQRMRRDSLRCAVARRGSGPCRYTSIVWLTIFFHAFGGLTVAAVVKYANSILKGFAAGE